MYPAHELCKIYDKAIILVKIFDKRSNSNGISLATHTLIRQGAYKKHSFNTNAVVVLNHPPEFCCSELN